MNTENLKTFILLAESGSFTKTAQQLFIAQSTVTKRIADMELELNKRLFVRNSKAAELTEEGLLYLSYAKRLLDLEAEAAHEMNVYSKYEHFFRIGTTNTIYECHLFPQLQKMLNTDNHTAVKITLGHSNELIQMLYDNTADAIFSYIPLHKSGYYCSAFAQDRLVLVTSYAMDACPAKISREDLKKIDYLMCNFALREVGIFIRELFPRYYRFKLEIDNSTKLIDYLLAGAGYSFLPESLIKEYIEKGLLKVIDLTDLEPPVINCYAACRESNEAAFEFIRSL